MNETIKIAEILRKNGYESYIVGGAVRDFILGQAPHDIDFATNATPDEIEVAMKKAGVFTTNVGKKFGTIVAYLDGEGLEITTYRKDGAILDGRHPDGVTYSKTIEEDLSRRDFTMNAMAMNPFTKEIVDPFGGRVDLKGKRLRFVGNIEDRIKEDALRIARAVRFAIKYNLEITLEDEKIIKKNAYLMKNVSKERKVDELKKILTCGGKIAPLFERMPELMLQIIPELEPTVGCSQKNPYHHHDVYNHILATVDGVASNKFEIKLAALLHDIGKPDCKMTIEESYDEYEHFLGHPKRSKEICEDVFNNSLAVTKKERDLVTMLVEHHDINYFQTEKQLKRSIVKFGEPFLRDLVVLQYADMRDHTIPPDMTEERKRKWYTPKQEIEEMLEHINSRENCLSLRDLAIKGNDLKDLGYEGKEIGDTLKSMLDAVVDGAVKNEKDELIQFLEKEELEKDL